MNTLTVGGYEYKYELNICKSDIEGAKNGTSENDIWGCAIVWNKDGNGGAEYNLCYDDGMCCSAVYKFEGEDTDYNVFEHYEINISRNLWEVRLIAFMISRVKEWFE